MEGNLYRSGQQGRVTATAFLDYQSTTPLAPEAFAAMTPWLTENHANPHSPHRAGREAAAAIALAREAVQALIGGSEGQIIFTSGATEAANIGLIGAAWAAPRSRRRLVTLASEHACVLDTIAWLGRQGFEGITLPVGRDGLVDLDQAADAINDQTALVAAMLVNNEIGVVQPIAALSALARDAGARFFCDAVQGIGRVPLASDACDMIALSAHKLHGPKGVGALWLREDVTLEPVSHGGGQEAGLRSGTLSPALCAGFGRAAALMTEHRAADADHVERLWQFALQRMDGWLLNGHATQRYHGNLNLRRDGLDAARLISDVRAVAFSAGSACASGSGRPSHVLAALGLDTAGAASSIRLGFGRYTTMAEMRFALDAICAGAAQQGAIAA